MAFFLQSSAAEFLTADELTDSDVFLSESKQDALDARPLVAAEEQDETELDEDEQDEDEYDDGEEQDDDDDHYKGRQGGTTAMAVLHQRVLEVMRCLRPARRR